MGLLSAAIGMSADYARKRYNATGQTMQLDEAAPHLIDPLTLEYRALAAQGAFQNPYAFASWLQSRVPQKRPTSGGVGSGRTGGV